MLAETRRDHESDESAVPADEDNDDDGYKADGDTEFEYAGEFAAVCTRDQWAPKSVMNGDSPLPLSSRLSKPVVIDDSSLPGGR